MPQKHLGIMLPSLAGGGAERLSLSLAREFSEIGLRVTFIVMRRHGVLLPEATAVARVLDLQTTRARRIPTVLPEILRVERFDAVIANIWPLTAMAALAVRRLRRGDRPLLALVEHNPLSLQYKSWGFMTRAYLRVSQMAACRISDRRISVSEGVADDTAELASMSRTRFRVVNNPVPPVSATADSLGHAEAVWGERAGRRILSVGSLKNQKNPKLAIDAFAAMRRPGDRLMLLGEGDLRSDLEAYVRERQVSDAVLMPGFFPDPNAFYLTADLFVLSSDYEGFGNVIVEALSAGLPVVSTDCRSGPAEVLAGGRFGRLVPVGDSAALARAMALALSEPGDTLEKRRRAEDFAPSRVAQQYIDVLWPKSADHTLSQ